MASSDEIVLLDQDVCDSDCDDGGRPSSSRNLIPHSLGPQVGEKLTISSNGTSVVATEQDSIVAIFVVAFDTRSGLFLFLYEC